MAGSKIMSNLFCVMCVLHSEHHVWSTMAHTVVIIVRFTDNQIITIFYTNFTNSIQT
jgi:hypothetical protein